MEFSLKLVSITPGGGRDGRKGQRASERSTSKSTPEDPVKCPGRPFRPTCTAALFWFLVGVVVVGYGVPGAAFVLVATIVTLLTFHPLQFALYLTYHGPNAFYMTRWVMMRQHRQSFTKMESHPAALRLLQIDPGSGDEPLQCRLVSTTWDATQYEALSYTWGSEQIQPRMFVWLDGKRFWDKPTLIRALSCLRRLDQPRLIWIDSMCIDQSDGEEKAEQVSKMRDIYAHAARVVVWLDSVTFWSGPNLRKADTWESLECLFDKLRGLAGKDQEEILALFTQLSKLQKDALVKLLRLPWWQRVWVIQEVAAGRHVTFQCRNLSLDWDDLRAVITCPKLQANSQIPEEVTRFVQQIELLRHDHPDGSYGLLSLVFEFRHSRATLAKDRVFALMGLIRSQENSLDITVDYGSKDLIVFCSFAKACIKKYGSLNVFVALEDAYTGRCTTYMDTVVGTRATRALSAPSWIYQGLLRFSEPESSMTPLWSGGLAPDTFSQGFSAAGNAAAICRPDLADPEILGLQGFEVDTIKRTGKPYYRRHSEELKCRTLAGWHKLMARARGQKADHLDCDFTVILTAGVETESNFDWSQSASVPSELLSTIDEACNARRLFVTRNGRIGIGHKYCRPGDLVCILLGAAVPYILRESNHSGLGFFHSTGFACFRNLRGCKRAKHLGCCFQTLHHLVGQAYVHGIMQYQGDIHADIDSGKVDLKDFFLE